MVPPSLVCGVLLCLRRIAGASRPDNCFAMRDFILAPSNKETLLLVYHSSSWLPVEVCWRLLPVLVYPGSHLSRKGPCPIKSASSCPSKTRLSLQTPHNGQLSLRIRKFSPPNRKIPHSVSIILFHSH
mmetsp:Transcript_3866/g.14619  ORF Transcript_3866/g.14619 Transcript_3866/m.14619 type:complete len:128 (-) Transcript_3866:809-1192(-)